jgi:hypothetical protein
MAATSNAGSGKAAGIVAAGGGPEDPVTDLLALAALKKGGRKPKAPRASGSNKLLLTEFLVCFLVLGAGTIVAPQGSADGVPRLMTRGTGLCLLFLILSLASGAGPSAKKVSAGIGGLVTVSYLVISSDATNLLSWMTKFFGTTAGTPTGPVSVAAPLPTSPPPPESV